MNSKFPLTRRLALTSGLAIGLLATPAGAQFQPENGATAAASEAEMLDTGPTTLPGEPLGPRTRAEPKLPEPPAEPAEWLGGKPWTEWSHASGNWGGLRDRLSNAGLTINGSYVMDWSFVLSGGIEETDSIRQLINVNAAFNFETAGLWKGATAFVDAHVSFSGGGSADAGDFQGISSISTGGKNIHQISQLWYEQKCWDDVLRFKLGKIDACSEFNFVSVAGDFLNSSGINSINTLSSIPTYPNPSTGVVAFVYPTQTVYLGAGLFDGATLEGFPTGPRGPSTFFSDSDAESWFIIGEGGASWDPEFGRGRLALGVWHHTAELTAFDSSTVDGNTGVYAMIEQQLWRRGGVRRPHQGAHRLRARGLQRRGRDGGAVQLRRRGRPQGHLRLA